MKILKMFTDLFKKIVSLVSLFVITTSPIDVEARSHKAKRSTAKAQKIKTKRGQSAPRQQKRAKRVTKRKNADKVTPQKKQHSRVSTKKARPQKAVKTRKTTVRKQSTKLQRRTKRTRSLRTTKRAIPSQKIAIPEAIIPAVIEKKVAAPAVVPQEALTPQIVVREPAAPAIVPQEAPAIVQVPEQPDPQIPAPTFRTRAFVKEEHLRLGELDFVPFPIADLGYADGERSRTQQYATMHLPAAPVFHPYHPDENTTHHASPAFMLNLKCPQGNLGNLPASVLANLQGIAPENIDRFTIYQDMPYAGVPLQLKPQYWLEPNAPSLSVNPYENRYNVRAGVFSSMFPEIRIQVQPDGGLLEQVVSIHNDLLHGNQFLLSSGDVLPIENLDMTVSQILWAVIRYTDNVTGIERTAVVKGGLLTLEDQQCFAQALRGSNNVTELEERVRLFKAAGNFGLFNENDLF